ncbi:MAG: phasin family protein [Rhizobiaceae bacterium]
MTQSFEEVSKAGKDYMDASLKSFAALSTSLQSIAAEATEYAKKSYETGSAALEKMLAAKSVEKALEIQADYGKVAYESFVAQATKMSDMFADLAKEAYKPIETAAVKAR